MGFLQDIKIQTANTIVQNKIKHYALQAGCPVKNIRAEIKAMDDTGAFEINLYNDQEFIRKISIGELMG